MQVLIGSLSCINEISYHVQSYRVTPSGYIINAQTEKNHQPERPYARKRKKKKTAKKEKSRRILPPRQVMLLLQNTGRPRRPLPVLDNHIVATLNPTTHGNAIPLLDIQHRRTGIQPPQLIVAAPLDRALMIRPLDVNRRQPCFGLPVRCIGRPSSSSSLYRVLFPLGLVLDARVAIPGCLARSARIGVLVCAEDSAAEGDFDQGGDCGDAGCDYDRVGFDAGPD